MATAEKLLQEAQYAFQCISFGKSRANARNRSRAKSLCKKIISKYPATMEAGEAHAILRRLGEEAYTSSLAVRHRHISQESHHSANTLARAQARTPLPDAQYAAADDGVVETLDWGRLLGMLLDLPKVVLAVVAFAGVFLFGILGPFLFVPLVLFVMFTGPFRQMLKAEQRNEMNAFIARVNDYMERRERGEI